MSTTTLPGKHDRAVIDLDPATGQVLAVLAGPLGLKLQEEPTTWYQLLGCSDDADHPMAIALAGYTDVTLPIFTIHPDSGGNPLLVTGEVQINNGPDQKRASCTLLPLLSQDQLGDFTTLQPGDVVIALVILPETSANSGPAGDGTELLPMAQKVLRPGDCMLTAGAAGLVMGLRGSSIEQATSLAREAASQIGKSWPSNKPTVGVGICALEWGPMTAIEQANNAAARAALDPRIQSAHVAEPGDAGLLTRLSSVLRGVVPQVLEGSQSGTGGTTLVNPMETGISGYVIDNMEGAVDQALFLAKTEAPVAVIGPRGTGKMYLARLIHEARSSETEDLILLNCREMGARSSAIRQIDRALRGGAGRTLVFKSPHLLHPEAQLRLARQLANRTQADTRPRQYLPGSCYIALFPLDLHTLVAQGELQPRLASVFAAYPIVVPPLAKRRRGILRWAHKILEQESLRRDRLMRGFTADAEVALRDYNWPGNITEMRSCIRRALDNSDTPWLTPVDLNLFPNPIESGLPRKVENADFLTTFLEEEEVPEDDYAADPQEQLNQALGAAVAQLKTLAESKPLGTWLEDEIILAALARFRQDNPRTARFLHTRPRNISRRMDKITARAPEREQSALWQESTRLIRAWLEEYPQQETSPLERGWDMLLNHVQSQMGDSSVAERAAVMGVSAPTLRKRLETSDE